MPLTKVSPLVDLVVIRESLPLYFSNSGLAHIFGDWVCWVESIMLPIISYFSSGHPCRSQTPNQLPISTMETSFYFLSPSCRRFQCLLVLGAARDWYCKPLTS